MKKRNYKVYLEDIIESIDKIERYISGMNFDKFCHNEMVMDAVFRNLEIIGEASKNIPDGIKVKHPEIPWKRMIGLRNIVIHAYFGIDSEIIWKIINTNLPEAKPKITSLLKHLSDDNC